MLANQQLRSAGHSEMDRVRPGEPNSLEASLTQMINVHHYRSLKLRAFTEESKKGAVHSANRVSNLLVDAVNGSVQEAYVIEKKIELEIRALAAAIMRFGKQTDQWLASSHAINTAIKEIGDFENWMKTMEFDCRSISAAIRNIHQS
ncbi:biogenesis of lysosome-related organelles complex 1 subunit 1 isoform X1 [Ipomoea triloba]|uniref:biogenesis of lysosome-related organelles complex 1 subunit 1 isoform X1 n=2 Tax=Ipomoea triloba TaxID=35885 RepID=UPI00125E822E|nr:biogenesis of lysosome-related organelles complex 1 subunit 1 isoform X1 [Ipomoea triloba]